MDSAAVNRILDSKPARLHAADGLRAGKAARKQASRKPAGRRQPMANRMPRLALAVTLTIGVAIPALTLSLSTLAGRLQAAGAYWLAASAAAIGVSVLAVSLDHLAWAIGDITRSPRWASWALAIAVDLSIVLAEAACSFQPSAAGWLAYGLLAAVTACSMLLNCWAFVRK